MSSKLSDSLINRRFWQTSSILAVMYRPELVCTQCCFLQLEKIKTQLSKNIQFKLKLFQQVISEEISYSFTKVGKHSFSLATFIF